MDTNWLSYAQNMIDFGPKIEQISIFLNETNIIWKLSINLKLFMNISSISTLLWIMWSNNYKKWTKSPISQFVIFKDLTLFKIIELNRVCNIFSSNFRSNVELNFNLKFFEWNFELGLWKNLAAKFWKMERQISEFGRQTF